MAPSGPTARAWPALLRLGVKAGGKVRISAQGAGRGGRSRGAQAADRSRRRRRRSSSAARRTAGSPRAAGATVPGLAASPGLAIGPLRLLRQRKIVVERLRQGPGAGAPSGCDEAIETARVELQELYQDVKAKSGAAGAAIFLAHAEFLADPDLLARAGRGSRRGRAPAGPGSRSIEAEADALAKLDDPLLAGRATDLRDVGTRVLRRLAECDRRGAGAAGRAGDPAGRGSDARRTPRRSIRRASSGFCTAGGGPTSHAAIIARSLGIPAVVGVGPVADASAGGRAGGPRRRQRRPLRRSERGTIWPRRAPRRARWPICATRSTGRATSRRSPPTACASRWSPTPAWRREAAQAVEAGGEGIGLMRSEFLFLERDAPPSEDEQYAAYRRGGRGPGRPAADPAHARHRRRQGGALPRSAGRGQPVPRACAASASASRYPELFKTQLRAIFRAAAHGPVKIMYPMIAGLGDLREAVAITEQVRAGAGRRAGRDRHHDRGAVGGDDGAGAGGGGRFLFDRHQRPDAIRAGDGPRPSAAGPAGRRPAPGGAADDRSDGARHGRPEYLGRRLRRRGGRAAGRGDPDRSRRHRAQRQHPEHRGDQGAGAQRLHAGRAVALARRALACDSAEAVRALVQRRCDERPPVVTVTLNPAIDQTAEHPRFRRGPGEPGRRKPVARRRQGRERRLLPRRPRGGGRRDRLPRRRQRGASSKRLSPAGGSPIASSASPAARASASRSWTIGRGRRRTSTFRASRRTAEDLARALRADRRARRAGDAGSCSAAACRPARRTSSTRA